MSEPPIEATDDSFDERSFGKLSVTRVGPPPPPPTEWLPRSGPIIVQGTPNGLRQEDEEEEEVCSWKQNEETRIIIFKHYA